MEAFCALLDCALGFFPCYFLLGCNRLYIYVVCYIGTRGKTPEHNQAKHTKHPHSLEWHNSTITIVFPSTLRNTLVVMTKHNATTPNQSTIYIPLYRYKRLIRGTRCVKSTREQSRRKCIPTRIGLGYTGIVPTQRMPATHQVYLQGSATLRVGLAS